MALALVLKNNFARAACDYYFYRCSVQNNWTLLWAFGAFRYKQLLML